MLLINLAQLGQRKEQRTSQVAEKLWSGWEVRQNGERREGAYKLAHGETGRALPHAAKRAHGPTASAWRGSTGSGVGPPGAPPPTPTCCTSSDPLAEPLILVPGQPS